MRKKVFIVAVAATLASLAFFLISALMRPTYVEPPFPPPCVPCGTCYGSGDVPYTGCPAPTPVPPTILRDYVVPTPASSTGVSLPLPDADTVALSDDVRQAILVKYARNPQTADAYLLTADQAASDLFADYGTQLSDMGWTNEPVPAIYITGLHFMHLQKGGTQLWVVAEDATQQPDMSYLAPKAYATQLADLVQGHKTVILVVKGTDLNMWPL